jgi:ADP-ribose pyrophosphatase
MAEILGKGKYLRLMKRGQWEFVERVNATGAVAIIAVNEKGNLILVEQHREALGELVLELPAGLVGDEGAETLEEAARRELLEETGYMAGAMRLVAQGPSTPGMSDEIVTLFYAENVTRVQEGGGVADEKITVHEWNPELLGNKAAELPEGHHVDIKVYAALYFLMREKAKALKKT